MRIRIDKRSTELIEELTNLYNFKLDGVITRIAFAYNLQSGARFDPDGETGLDSDGRDWRDERTLFGSSADDKGYFVVYKAILDQHYERILSEEQFARLFKSHLHDGLQKIKTDLATRNIASGYHIAYLMKMVKNGVSLISDLKQPVPAGAKKEELMIPEYAGPVKLTIGQTEQNLPFEVCINDLKEFDSCNMAIAGMVGSGKTELVKDLLYQISKQSDQQLKFVFFDYKGEGNPDRLKTFFDTTGSRMIDVRSEAMPFNPLSYVTLDDPRLQVFNIKSFVDAVADIAPGMGYKQKMALQSIVQTAFDQAKVHPTIQRVAEIAEEYYAENKLTPDTVLAILRDLSNNIFSDQPGGGERDFYEDSLYVNLPLELSDTLRQLCVFLTLKYLLQKFNSTNDTRPDENRIKPLRYVIVIDEAHVYLKNKNASKALENILRVLRSKGVVTMMLTQGVEDYKTKDFDFASQIKIPICLNINNKDFKLIESFVGTSRSRQKLQDAINKLEPQKALINLPEPQILKINQFWRTEESLSK